MAQVTRRAQIVKVVEEKRVIKAPVLRPEIEDRQGTIISASVIEDACHDFNARLGLSKAEAGAGPKLMHAGSWNDGSFHEKLVIVESYITTQDETFKVVQEGGDDVDLHVPAGSWMMAMKVHDDEIWESVLSGHFRGFSIGGIADIADEPEVQEEAA